MKLMIKHSLAASETAGETLYQATYYLREPGTEGFTPPVLDPRFAGQNLSDLAKRWYSLNNPANVPDANEALLSGHPSADTTLGTFIPAKGRKVFEFESTDPILIFALDERVKRAVAMIVEDAVYGRYFLDTPESQFDLGSKEHAPSGSVLPPVPLATREKATAMFKS